MEKVKLDIEGLAEVPVHQLNKFLKFISEHNLWDEMEQHLKDRGCDKLFMSFEPVKSIGNMVEMKQSELAGGQRIMASSHLKCGCNGPVGPRPGPVTPTNPDSDTKPQ